MPEEILREKEEKRAERTVLLYYFVYSVVLTFFTLKNGWPVWLALFTDLGWAAGLFLHVRGLRSYLFRAFTVTCFMQMSVVFWSVYKASLSLAVPVFLMNMVILIYYEITEIVYVPVLTFIFMCIYHLLIARTVDFSDERSTMQTMLEILAVLFIENVIYLLNKKRLEGEQRQKEILEELEETRRSKDDFMANVSHEIRTPINTICGTSEIVLREALTDKVREDVYNIQTAGRSLQSIVSDILDFTEMQSGKTTLVEESYNITSTINDVINMTLALKNEKQIDLIVDCDADLPSGLVGDEQKIRRIIMNLVNNALKFTSEGCVSIIISFWKTDYGINLIVRVRDTGIGMKKESMEKLFTNFNQVDAKRNRRKEGIGLGLAIAQQLVDRMGGFITVSSELGKGSEIQFVIPQKVTDFTPIAAVQDRESINAAIYVDMERYDRPDVREAYSLLIYHIISRLKVKCHVCQNLPELKRRAERETLTHVFISIEEYEEDRAFFDVLSENTTVVAIIERFNDVRIANKRIRKLYKPFFILPITMVLNGRNMMQSLDASYFYQGKFIAPDSRVLIVDDNILNIRVLEGLLKPYMVQVDTAVSGAEALKKTDSMKYDVIFMDHMMPEMDGIETLKRIRLKPGNYFKNVPIVAVTANAIGGMREVFLNEGFQDFVAKPIEVSVLERVLARVLPQEKLVPVPEDDVKRDAEAVPKVSNGAESNYEVKRDAEAVHNSDQKGAGSKNVPRRLTDLPEDVFDEKLGVRYCGSLEDYKEILRLVAQTWQEESGKLQDMFDRQDWNGYATLAHALKSSMLSIGAEKLSAMAKALELAGKGGDAGFIMKYHADMMEEYKNIRDLISASAVVMPDKSR